MSWGYRITILYLGFVGIIVTLVTISSQNKEELVSKDYYAQELMYQKKLDAINNEKDLAETIKHQVTDSAIVLFFNSDAVSGTVNFFCPSDSKKDKSFAIKFNKGVQKIKTKDLMKGAYKMQMSWKLLDKSYFREEIVNIK
jgi:hypothetical protein